VFDLDSCSAQISALENVLQALIFIALEKKSTSKIVRVWTVNNSEFNHARFSASFKGAETEVSGFGFGRLI
jgi:hypothetical protein